jgi:hypothetical protein
MFGDLGFRFSVLRKPGQRAVLRDRLFLNFPSSKFPSSLTLALSVCMHACVCLCACACACVCARVRECLQHLVHLL